MPAGAGLVHFHEAESLFRKGTLLLQRFRAVAVLECEPRSNAEPKPNPYSRK